VRQLEQPGIGGGHQRRYLCGRAIWRWKHRWELVIIDVIHMVRIVLLHVCWHPVLVITSTSRMTSSRLEVLYLCPAVLYGGGSFSDHDRTKSEHENKRLRSW